MRRAKGPTAPHGHVQEGRGNPEAPGSARRPSLEDTLAGLTPESTADRTARLAADARVVEILRADNFQGPLYRMAMSGWMDYGWRTVSKWTATNEIFVHARQAGRPVPIRMATPDWNADDRAEICTDTVIAGHGLFLEHGLIRGKWTPAGGASLTTYFVGACIRSFSPVYQCWFRARDKVRAQLDLRGDDETCTARVTPYPYACEPFSTAAVNEEIRNILLHITDSRVREGLVLRALGYSQRQAAEEVGLTEKALESRISRLRARLLAEMTDHGEGRTR
jgi:hypothetical protein